MKKLSLVLSVGLAIGVFGGLASNMRNLKEARADEEPIVKYYPIDSAHFWTDDFSGNFKGNNFNNLIRNRGERFWSGGGNEWDSQERSFNALTNFIDTVHRAGGENQTGGIRSVTWEHKGGQNKYVSFLLGGGPQDDTEHRVFVNVWNQTRGYNVVENIQPAFDGREDLSEGHHLRAPISNNMVLKYVEIPDDCIGDELIIYIEDGKTGNYGGVTFSDLKFNQTLEEVAQTFADHKAQMELNKGISDWTREANEFVLNYYATNDYYAALRTAEAALPEKDNADDGFESGEITNWLYDGAFSGAAVNCNSVVSTVDTKNWTEVMPMNKTGNYFLNADTSGVGEAEKYRFVSRPFELSGTGIISAKLGGATAVLSLLDEGFVELESTRMNEATGENVLNPGFVDTSVGNVVESGSRCNTMNRTYLDCSAHVGDTVRVALSDDRTGGAWGLAYFDEVITKYESLPTFKVDTFTQDFNGLKYGYNLDKYVGPNDTTFGKAYSCLQTYYSNARPNGIADNSKATQRAVFDAYRVLPNDAKAIVNASQDVVRNSGEGDWWTHTLDTSGTVSTYVSAIALTYNVSFDKNGGEGEMATQTKNYLSSYELPACGYTAPSNYHFVGWKIADEVHQPGEEITINNDITLVAQWAIDTYEVSFNANGAEGSMANVVQDYGATYELPSNGFTVPQYQQFTGWKVNGGEVKQPGEEITITGAVELTAQWAYIQHTVSFNANGAEGAMSGETVNEGTLFTLPECGFTPLAHQEFAGWKVGGEDYQVGDKIQVLGDVEVVAQWKTIQHTIMFAANGGTGTLASVVRDEGTLFEIPVNPFTAPEHKHFVGWKINGVGNLLQAGEEVEVTKDIIFVAQWQYNQHTVSFAANGGSGTMTSDTADESFQYMLPGNGFTAPQYKEFVGWKVGDDETIRQPGYVFTITDDVVVTAQWAVITHWVSFDAGDGGSGSMADVLVEEGVQYSLPEPTFTAPDGMMFAGWKVNDGGDLLQPNTTILVGAAIELVAQWKEIPIVTYEVSFHANGGTGSMSAVIKEENSVYTLPANGFTAPSGKEFSGWKVNNTGELKQPGAEITITADTVLYAQWKNIKHTVSFSANGGSSSMPDVIKNENDSYTLPECSFNAPSYNHFVGWKVNGVGELKQPGDVITITTDIQLVAQWEITEHTISFSANGGQGSMASLVRNEGTLYALPACGFTAPENKEFVCWKVNDAYLNPGDEIIIDDDVELVAQWGNIQHTILFNANGGNGIMFDEHADQGSEYTLPVCSFEAPANMQFVGWKLGNEVLQPGAKITIEGDVTLVAQWEMIVHTITFVPNSGTGTMDPVEKDQGSEYVLPECGYTAPEHYEFAGWRVGSETLQPGDKITVTDDVTITPVWSIIEHAIVFDGNGGSGSMTNTSSIEGVQYTLPECEYTAPANMEFAGWRVGNSTELLQPGAKILIDENKTLTAVWQYIERNVAFNSGEGTGSMDPVVQAQGALYTLPECEFTAPEGKEFAGWKINNDGDLLQPGAKITIGDDMELVAQWQVIQHTISFSANGGTGSMVDVVKNEGDKYELPACTITAPENQEFVGWKLGNQVLQPGDEITVDADVELVAQWQMIEHIVSFNSNGGQGSMAPVNQNQGSEYELPACEFTAPENKEFVGWKVGNEVKQPGEKITIGDDMELVAQWQMIEHTISFDGNGAQGSMDPVVKDQGSTYVLPECSFEVPANKEFVGWKVGNDAVIRQPGYELTVSADVVITAQWKNIEHTISFSANGGTGTVADVTKDQGSVYALPECGFTAPENKEFIGWKINGTGELLQPGTQITVSEDIQLVAQWQTITHTVTFNSNGGQGSMDAVNKDQGSTFVLPENTFVAPSDKEFVGWKVNGQGEVLLPGTQITISDDVELVAQWNEVVKYIVSFDGNGGTGVMSTVLVEEGETYTLPANLFTAPEGKEFAGWKVNGQGELLEAGVQITVTDDVQLVAQWKDTPAPVEPEPSDPTPVDPEPSEPEPTEPGNPSTEPEDNGGNSEPEAPAKKGGCGGSIIASSAILSLVSLLGAGLLVFKKKKEDK